MLSIKHVSKSYGQLKVLDNVSLDVNQGELVGIVGKSGAGKSTLLHIAGTLDSADSGEVFINNIETSALRGNKLSDFRNDHIGFIFQFHHLLPEFTAIENVMIPGFISGTDKKKLTDKAHHLMEAIGMSDRKEHKPGSLSGGEQQRVAIARALINDPDIVFADEPTGNLDSLSSEQVHRLFLELNETLEQTFVIVTHNEQLASICHRRIEMADGQII